MSGFCSPFGPLRRAASALAIACGALTALGAGAGAALAGEISTAPVELVFSSVISQATAAQAVLVRNTGTSPLQITSLARVGPQAADFQLLSPPATPFSIAAGSAVSVSVRFLPTAVGVRTAALRIGSNDAAHNPLDVGLYGLSAQGLEGSNEPPLHRVVTTLGHTINVGGTNLSLGTGAAPIGDEVLSPRFEKAGAGAVLMVPVARYSPAFILPFGWYTPNGAAPVRHEVGRLSGSSNPAHHQTLYPPLVAGATAFDPGVQPFGLYTTGNSHSAYSEDPLNLLLHPANVQHAVRVYPLRNRIGVLVSNAYLVGFEEASNGDYQDYVFTVYNVRPAGTGVDADGDGVTPPTDCDDTDATAFPGAPELCDAADNDCDGTVDEGNPGGGATCQTGQLGVCAAGVGQCVAGALVCGGPSPAPETCDGLDNDCDGATDEGNPGAGATCQTGQPGACAAGVAQCVAGALACVGPSPAPESCDGLDNDCDGIPDDGNPQGGGSCSSGLSGTCAAGVEQCVGGGIVCVASSAVPETCDGLDNDCDGVADDGNPGAGGACTSGAPGVCSAGTEQCQAGALVCVGGAPGIEVCANGLDEDCDGIPDAADACVPCAAEDTIPLTTQTKTSAIKRASAPDRDRIVIAGSFILPVGSAHDFSSEAIIVRLESDASAYYEATLPAGALRAGPNGRTYSYLDRIEPFELGGLRQARLAVKRDGVTVRYLFKARALSLPAFSGTRSTVTVKIGTSCYADPADTCTSSSSGAVTKCR